MENKDYADSFAKENPKAPYLAKTLPPMGAMVPNYYGIGHHSLTNYVAVISGQGPNPQTQADCPVFTEFAPGTPGADGQAMGGGCVYPQHVQTIADQLQAKGMSWKGYMESMAVNGPATCRHPAIGENDDTQTANGENQYAAKHNPFVYFHSIIDSPFCAMNDVDLNNLLPDIANVDTTANYIFITPNLCHDGHDEPCIGLSEPGGLASIDEFLKKWVPEILASPGYRDDGLLVVSFDEADHDNSSCCNERASNTPNAAGESPGTGGGKAGAILISPFIKPGTVDETPYNHYSFLRFTQDLWGFAHLGYAAQEGLVPLGDKIFNNPVPQLTLSVKRRVQPHGARSAMLTLNAERRVKIRFSGACRTAPRETDDLGLLKLRVRLDRRSAYCRMTASRPNWQGVSRRLRLVRG
jgi:hypothetical protein